MKEQPFAWIETIHHQLSEMKMIPLTGNGPKFPFKEMEHRLTALLEVDSVKIEMEQMEFLPFNDLLSGSEKIPSIFPWNSLHFNIRSWFFSQENSSKKLRSYR